MGRRTEPAEDADPALTPLRADSEFRGPGLLKGGEVGGTGYSCGDGRNSGGGGDGRGSAHGVGR